MYLLKVTQVGARHHQKLTSDFDLELVSTGDSPHRDRPAGSSACAIRSQFLFLTCSTIPPLRHRWRRTSRCLHSTKRIEVLQTSVHVRRAHGDSWWSFRALRANRHLLAALGIAHDTSFTGVSKICGIA
ncbi:hypothetical protein F441_08014 [Phytophthora nicotianae CJ01A1]|uniref:Uncharacterized protein n=2 Tax=Phytophthora nicotianae TaxID=4792 RepID=V9FBI7_PHYNI|nr:hypothetical protein F443_08048 [Phytophthora nicotianae P1569]ETP17612.1 hypothetical protein F441_08014 [Phytophthora nicotianae CJ01A1]